MEQNQRFIDPSTIRKNNIVKERLRFHEGVLVFSIVEFNIHGNCTRRCKFCPVGDTNYKKTNDSLDPDLYRKILNDLASIDYEGKILFSAFSEPLLHKKLEDLFTMTKQILPGARMEIISNGDLFTKEKLRKMYDAGLDTISVSVYDGPEQMARLQNMKREYGLTDDQMILRRRYLEDGNYGMTISNRTGLIDANQFRDAKEEAINALPLKSRCFYPYYMTIVDLNGDMLLCPHDWRKTSKMGNLATESIWDLWRGKYLEFARTKLGCGERKFSPCNTCDIKGDVIGKDHFEAWTDNA